MNADVKEIQINGTTYVPKGSESTLATANDGLDYAVVRAEKAGAFAGYVESEDGQTVVLRNARRLWYWDGAASLSELAIKGVSKPHNCKFPAAVQRIKIHGVIEVIPATEVARDSIESVKIWSA